jgi:hypothetical protein
VPFSNPERETEREIYYYVGFVCKTNSEKSPFLKSKSKPIAPVRYLDWKGSSDHDGPCKHDGDDALWRLAVVVVVVVGK